MCIKGTPQENEFAAASKAIFEIGKALKPEMASITDNSITTIDSISRCCKKFPEACEANKRVVELQGLIRNTADLIQNIQLEGECVLSLKICFNSVLVKRMIE